MPEDIIMDVGMESETSMSTSNDGTDVNNLPDILNPTDTLQPLQQESPGPDEPKRYVRMAVMDGKTLKFRVCSLTVIFVDMGLYPSRFVLTRMQLNGAAIRLKTTRMGSFVLSMHTSI